MTTAPSSAVQFTSSATSKNIFPSNSTASLETLTAIKLRAPQLLRTTIMNTNPIESIFDRIKTNCARVKNWQNSPDQVSRWAATFTTEAEKHFRTIKGFKQIPLVVAELENLNLQEKLEIA